jgi:hypothetical protein
VPVCFSGEMRNSRGALTPAWPGLRNPCPARAALFYGRRPCRSEAGQPYMITIVLAERSMRNSGPFWPLALEQAGRATLPFSVGRGIIGQSLGGQRGTHKLLDSSAALSVLNRERAGGPIAGYGPFFAA